jgi:hypothetical protein
MRPAAHLTHEPLLLHLAPKLAQCLLELLRILYDDLQAVITSFVSESFAPPPSRQSLA